MPELALTPEVWNEACDLARRCRAGGVSVPATDLLIAACARHHGAPLEQSDGDFEAIARVSTREADESSPDEDPVVVDGTEPVRGPRPHLVAPVHGPGRRL